MALLRAKVGPRSTKLLARWSGGSMMGYLHQQAMPIFERLAERMLSKGTYSLLPSLFVLLFYQLHDAHFSF